MKGKAVIIILLLTVLAVIVCFLLPKHNKVQPSFYYWKTVYNLTENDSQLLNSLDVKKLYVKYFDVTWNQHPGEPKPEAIIKFSTPVNNQQRIIPVVFIVNDVLKKGDSSQVVSLAHNVASLLKQINKVNNITVTELQFDCDWSDATREKYFMFLRKVKAQFKSDSILFSATIRLHQVKYFKRTGIPPVERGMLMFYNMGQLKNPITDNSIFDKKTALKYLDYIKSYPLQCDYALPIFTWGVHTRNNKVIGIENNISTADLESMEQLKQVKKNILLVEEGFFFRGSYFIKGDAIRIEEVTPQLALQASKLLSSEVNNNSFTVSLFHLDSSNIKRYAIKDFQNIYNSFY